MAETTDLACLNLRDAEGNTALALAVTYGNTRIVRRLLIKGASRSLRNKGARVPAQFRDFPLRFGEFLGAPSDRHDEKWGDTPL